MLAAICCPCNLITYFPASVYRSVGSSEVLPELLREVDTKKLSTLQFLRNGAVRLTFASAQDCDSTLGNGIVFRDVALKLTPVEARSRIVYLRDCPAEVLQSTISGTFPAYREIHSITNNTHEKYPNLFDGTRVIKMSITKVIPSFIRVAGFDCGV